jgi:ribosome biogenesis GTPase A
MWPRIIVAQSGFNLAVSGAIGVNAFDDEEVALELLKYLIHHYPQALKNRYQLNDIEQLREEEGLHAIGRQRGAVQSGGQVNTTKAAQLLIHDFRSLALGRVTLETPAEFAQWLKDGKKADAERSTQKEARVKQQHRP